MRKIKIMFIGSGNIALQVREKIQQDNRFILLGGGYDEERVHFKEEELSQVDLCFACGYHKLIPKKFVESYLFVNFHLGILPRWRGLSANGWAILNGADEIGYTIHRMDDRLDNGDIYYVKKFSILKEQTYADLYKIILKDMIDNICDILTSIYDKKLSPIKQNSNGFYFTRFCAKMGDLKDFDMESEYLRNLYRSMARPLGTGVYFEYKGRKYYPQKLRTGSDIGMDNYIGIPGKIVYCEDDSIWVKTRDNILILSDIQMEDGQRIPKGFFRIGNALGK